MAACSSNKQSLKRVPCEYECGIPFTNKFAENELRMTKVQQKISDCFRTMEGVLLPCTSVLLKINLRFGNFI